LVLTLGPERKSGNTPNGVLACPSKAPTMCQVKIKTTTGSAADNHCGTTDGIVE